MLYDDKDPLPSMTATVDDALRLGCSAVGYTIYPGSAHSTTMYEQFRQLVQDAKDAGLAAVCWSYPRGAALSKAGETATDVVAYAAQIAAQKVAIGTLSERVRHVAQSAFDGRRIVIFSGGAAREDDTSIFDELRAIRDGGGFGSIIGRNSFQRPRHTALAFLNTVMEIYAGTK